MNKTTVGDYMAWIKSTGGRCRTGVGQDDAIGMVPVTKIIAVSGRHVIFPGADPDEVLSPSTIENFDRRLMVISPFRGIQRS